MDGLNGAERRGRDVGGASRGLGVLGGVRGGRGGGGSSSSSASLVKSTISLSRFSSRFISSLSPSTPPLLRISSILFTPAVFNSLFNGLNEGGRELDETPVARMGEVIIMGNLDTGGAIGECLGIVGRGSRGREALDRGFGGGGALPDFGSRAGAGGGGGGGGGAGGGGGGTLDVDPPPASLFPLPAAPNKRLCSSWSPPLG